MVGIYAGEGASHSWTWFVTVMESLGLRGCRFLDGEDLRRGGLEGLGAVFVGGGDVEGMARELGEEGARGLDAFVRAGGVYVGSCAGAYLVMRGVDQPPYAPFALMDAGMANYLEEPPPPLRLPHKYKVAYGTGAVFHPAYGPVRVAMEEGSFLAGLGEITAALYGGPVILPGEGCERLAEYRGPAAGCAALVAEPLLSEMLEGTCAAARQRHGGGTVYACGPHFECPYFPQGAGVLARVLREENIYNMSNISSGGGRVPAAPAAPQARRLLKRVRSELSTSASPRAGWKRCRCAGRWAPRSGSPRRSSTTRSSCGNGNAGWRPAQGMRAQSTGWRNWRRWPPYPGRR